MEDLSEAVSIELPACSLLSKAPHRPDAQVTNDHLGARAEFDVGFPVQRTGLALGHYCSPGTRGSPDEVEDDY